MRNKKILFSTLIGAAALTAIATPIILTSCSSSESTKLEFNTFDLKLVGDNKITINVKGKGFNDLKNKQSELKPIITGNIIRGDYNIDLKPQNITTKIIDNENLEFSFSYLGNFEPAYPQTFKIYVSLDNYFSKKEIVFNYAPFNINQITLKSFEDNMITLDVTGDNLLLLQKVEPEITINSDITSNINVLSPSFLIEDENNATISFLLDENFKIYLSQNLSIRIQILNYEKTISDIKYIGASISSTSSSINGNILTIDVSGQNLRKLTGINPTIFVSSSIGGSINVSGITFTPSSDIEGRITCNVSGMDVSRTQTLTVNTTFPGFDASESTTQYTGANISSTTSSINSNGDQITITVKGSNLDKLANKTPNIGISSNLGGSISASNIRITNSSSSSLTITCNVSGMDVSRTQTLTVNTTFPGFDASESTIDFLPIATIVINNISKIVQDSFNQYKNTSAAYIQAHYNELNNELSRNIKNGLNSKLNESGIEGEYVVNVNAQMAKPYENAPSCTLNYVIIEFKKEISLPQNNVLVLSTMDGSEFNSGNASKYIKLKSPGSFNVPLLTQ